MSVHYFVQCFPTTQCFPICYLARAWKMELLKKKGAKMACFAGEAALWPQYQNHLQTTLLTPVTISIPKPPDTLLSFFLVFSHPRLPFCPKHCFSYFADYYYSFFRLSLHPRMSLLPLTQHPLMCSYRTLHSYNRVFAPVNHICIFVLLSPWLLECKLHEARDYVFPIHCVPGI